MAIAYILTALITTWIAVSVVAALAVGGAFAEGRRSQVTPLPSAPAMRWSEDRLSA